MRTGAAVLALSILVACAHTPRVYDVVVYGGTAAAVAAAVTASRLGMDVVVVSPDMHPGGMTSGGLGWTDTGRKDAIGGVAREFYGRIKARYDRDQAWRFEEASAFGRYDRDADAMWVFEPHVAEQVLEAMLSEAGVPVVRGAWLDREGGVAKDGARLGAVTTLGGQVFRGRMFIDATYEGDLMAAAGVTYAVGREGNAAYGETLNGVQTANATKHQFNVDISPYVEPGNPASGLLPRIHNEGPGTEGAGDDRIQAYNFRMCLTDAPDNRVPFERPAGYDPLQYELLARYLDAGWRGVFGKFDPLPNRKTDTNNHGAFSTDNIGMNYRYPEASYEERRDIIAEHAAYQKGLMWFLANDERVPADVRAEMSRWGLAADEFADNGHWPRQLYVREARRMVSSFVMTERHLRRHDPTPTPVGMGSYNMDSHNVQRYVDARGFARNEGDIQVGPGAPYPIGYGAIVPREQEAENLLVPVAVSSSHIAYGSIRMEPVFMILGQSAATAAALAIRAGTSVQSVDYSALRRHLLEAGQVLELREGWQQLFNGRDLSGWDVKIAGHDLGDNYAQTFRVEDGLLKVRYDGYDSFDGRFGYLFYHEPFSHYRLAVEYRFVGEQAPGHPGAWAFRNSGILVHGQPAETMLRDQNFPVSLEVQLLGGGGEDARPTANLCTAGTHVVMEGELVTDHCISSTSSTHHGDVWVRAEVLVLADSLVRHFVDGNQVFEYTSPTYGGGMVNEVDPAVMPDGAPVVSGTISLQSESHPLDIRKVEILNLAGCTDPEAESYRAYYLASDPDDCK